MITKLYRIFCHSPRATAAVAAAASPWGTSPANPPRAPPSRPPRVPLTEASTARYRRPTPSPTGGRPAEVRRVITTTHAFLCSVDFHWNAAFLGETLRPGPQAQVVQQTNNHQTGGFKRQNTVDSATIKENTARINARPANAQPKPATENSKFGVWCFWLWVVVVLLLVPLVVMCLLDRLCLMPYVELSHSKLYRSNTNDVVTMFVLKNTVLY